MPKCKNCGKWGLFLKLDKNGFCNKCALEPHYDLNSIQGIKSIPVKSFKYDPQDGKSYAYYNIEYILQRKATEHKKNGHLDLAIECLRKSNEIMPYSDMVYPISDYLRLAKYLRLDKQFDEAHKVEEMYSNGNSIAEKNFDINYINSKQTEYAQKMDTDLVDVVCNCYHCAQCSAYGNRVYSISGKDKRFPKLPDYVKNNAGHCSMIIYPFRYGIHYLTDPYTNKSISGSDVIEYSNRPFVDSRPQKWIDGYNHLLELNHKREVDALNSKQAQQEYEQIVIKLPDIAPKSQGGYLRMKKSGSDNYKKLKSAAEAVDIVIKDIIEP